MTVAVPVRQNQFGVTSAVPYFIAGKFDLSGRESNRRTAAHPRRSRPQPGDGNVAVRRQLRAAGPGKTIMPLMVEADPGASSP
jgi:hypothetical protein